MRHNHFASPLCHSLNFEFEQTSKKNQKNLLTIYLNRKFWLPAEKFKGKIYSMNTKSVSSIMNRINELLISVVVVVVRSHTYRFTP
jgi:hypothetical protein